MSVTTTEGMHANDIEIVLDNIQISNEFWNGLLKKYGHAKELLEIVDISWQVEHNNNANEMLDVQHKWKLQNIED